MSASSPIELDGPVLGTTQQQAAESLLLRLLADPEIRAAMAGAEAELSRGPVAQTADGRSRLGHTVAE